MAEKVNRPRDILHIEDFGELIDYQIHNMDKLNGGLFNVGGGEEIDYLVKELTAVCQKVTGNKVSIAEIEEDRQADIRIYISDNSLVSSVTGWQPTTTVESIVTDIYHWIKNNEALLKTTLIG